MPIDDFGPGGSGDQNRSDAPRASDATGFDGVLERLLEDLHGRRGLALLIGEAGTGKSVLLSQLKLLLEVEDCLVVLPRRPSTSFDELLKICCDAAGVAASIEDRLGRVHALTEILIERLEQGGLAVVMIDDAQQLAIEVLEDFARLTTVEKDGQKLVQLVIAGRPELVPQICNCAYPPLQESAIGHYRLESQRRPEAPVAAADDVDRAEAAENGEAAAPETDDAAVPDSPAQDPLPAWMGPTEVEEPEIPVEIPDPPTHEEEEAPEAAARQEEDLEPLESRAEVAEARPQEETPPEPPVSDDGTREEPAQQEALGEPQVDETPEEPVQPDTPPEPLVLQDRIFEPPAQQDEEPETTAPETEISEAPDVPDETPRLVALEREAAEPPAVTETEASEAPAASEATPQPMSMEDEVREPLDDPADRQEEQPAVAPILDGPVTTVTLARRKRRFDKRMPIAAGILIGLLLSGTALIWGGLSGSRQASDEPAPPAETLTAEATGAESSPESVAAAPQQKAQPSGKPAAVRIARFKGVGGAVLQVKDAQGKEDRALQLDVEVQLPDDIAGDSLSLAISNMPEGALLLAGTDNGDGTWSVGADQLANLTLIPPVDYSGRFEVMIEAKLSQAGEADVVTSLPIKIDLAGVADLPGLDVADAGGDGGAPIPLGIDATLTDGDGSESLVITISGLPEGARLTAGHELGDGRWRLRADQLEALALIPPPDSSAPAKLMVSATAQEADGDKATATLPLAVAISGKAKVARAETPSRKAAAPETAIAATGAEQPSAPATSPSKTASAPTRLAPDDAATASAATANAATAGSEQTGAVPTAVAKKAVPEAAAKPSAAPSGTGSDGFVLQLASFRSAADASREVARLEQRFSALLGDAELEVHHAEADDIVYYRVRTTPLQGWTKAYDLCAELKAQQQDCLVFQHGPGTRLAKLPAGELTPKDPPPAEPNRPQSLVAALPTGAAGPTGAEEGANLRVVDFVVARQIVDREPVDVSESFSSADGNAYAFARIANDGDPTALSFVWLHRDAIYAAVEMTIGTSPRWRTWSSAELQPGPWRVQLVSSDGLIIAENSFTVE